MNSWFKHATRVVGRFLWFAGELALAAFDYARMCGMRSSSSGGSSRSKWLQRASRRLLKVFRVELSVFGSIPENGLLVCNHLSYLDILVLGALAPSVFVSKSEVRRWPFLGWFACLGGTIFVDRKRPSKASQTASEIETVLRHGALVVLFPEGTSSGGDKILPFKSSLFEPVTREEHRVTAGHIRYNLPDGNASEEVCYWKDMTLIPHLINLLSKRVVRADIAFSPVRQRGSNRKELAQFVHSEVLRLKQECLSDRI